MGEFRQKRESHVIGFEDVLTELRLVSDFAVDTYLQFPEERNHSFVGQVGCER